MAVFFGKTESTLGEKSDFWHPFSGTIAGEWANLERQEEEAVGAGLGAK